MVEIAKGEVSRGGDVIRFAITEVDNTCSKQQSDAGSEANCPSDEGSGRVESETREPVADTSVSGRSLSQHRLPQIGPQQKKKS